MTTSSNPSKNSAYLNVNNQYEKLLSQSTHSPKQERRRLIVLVLLIVLFTSIYPFLERSAYVGNADFHATIELLGALFGLLVGFILITRFYMMSDHFHLFVGLAFFLNGVEDLIHGLLSVPYLQEWTGFSAFSLEHLISGTHISGRLMMGVFLVLALYMPARVSVDQNPKNTIRLAMAVLIPITAVAFLFPLLQLIHPGWFLSSSPYFISVIIFTVALFGVLWEYHRERDALAWWILLSIAVNIIGGVLMLFSRFLYDPFFSMAHVYKVLGYVILLFGLSLYHIAIIVEHKEAGGKTELAMAELDQIFNNASDGIRVIDKNFNMIRFNETFLNIVGMKKEELEGKKCYEVFYDSKCLTSGCPLSLILCEKGGRIEFEVKKERKDGVIIPCILTVTPFFSKDGKLIGVVEHFKDISNLKKADTAPDEIIKNLNETNQKLMQSNRDLVKFVFVVTNALHKPP